MIMRRIVLLLSALALGVSAAEAQITAAIGDRP